MAIATATYTLDPSSPSRSEPLRMRFEPALLNGKSKALILHPQSERSLEPTFTRYMAGIVLRPGDGPSQRSSVKCSSPISGSSG